MDIAPNQNAHGRNSYSDFDQTADNLRALILVWYDRNRRILPWRARHEIEKNPYYTWLSEIMLQQTTVPAVIPYFLKFIEKWPDIKALAAARDDDVMEAWAGLGYYARARNLLKCARIIAGAPYAGHFPVETSALQVLPGIGPYTAAAISSIAFDRPAVVIDGNIERVISRLFAIQTPLPQSKPEIKVRASGLAQGRTDRPGDYAQALMDLGAGVCTPKNPKCEICPVGAFCHARQMGIESDLPRKTPKQQKPTRSGQVYWVRRAQDQAVLFERRGADQMLGGMMGMPCSSWDDKEKPDYITDELNDILCRGDQTPNRSEIRHSFTHFHLRLSCYDIVIPEDISLPKNYQWLPPDQAREIPLPTLFKKAREIFL